MEPQCEERHWMTINVRMLFIAMKQPPDLQTNNYPIHLLKKIGTVLRKFSMNLKL